MIKKLCILLLSVSIVAPVVAQQYGNKDIASFTPKKGQWQMSVVLGNGTFFDESGIQRLLPTYNGTVTGDIGLGTASDNQSSDPAIYLNLGSLNYNNLVNIAGIQGKYFLTDRIDLNLMFSMNINITPGKDYVEGDKTVPDMNIPAYKFIEAKMSNNWMLALGSNYYFKTRNERINPYIGGVIGFQMGRIETNQPYTGITISDDNDVDNPSGNGVPGTDLPSTDLPNTDLPGTSTGNGNSGNEDLPQQVYIPSSRAGQLFGLNAGAVAGIEYSLAPGLLLGFEVQPVSYRYNVLQICPKGLDKYSASNHNVKVFASPVLKLGIRF